MKNLPAVGSLINEPEIKFACEKFGKEVVTFSIRTILQKIREEGTEAANLSLDCIKDKIIKKSESLLNPSLRSVINATGVVLHTNLGRAPLGSKIAEDLNPIIQGYSNLEFNLDKGKRGHRNFHLDSILQLITGAESAVVVNNTAAALILILSTLSKDREVIVSRGELIEIGGSFRIPEIMSAGNVKMVEVGTTNRTRITDYSNAITDKTGLLFKAHLSNFTQTGFVEEASLKELVSLSKEKNIPFVYDIGSGLLRKPDFLKDSDEPSVQDAIKAGCEIVTFSSDKLLGGPQGGIIVGKKKYIDMFLKAPLMRALRPCKLSIAALESSCRNYLREELLLKNNPSFSMLSNAEEISKKRSEILLKELINTGINAKAIKGTGQSGGGTLPNTFTPTTAVQVKLKTPGNISSKVFHDKVFKQMMKEEIPVIGVLRQGSIIFETLTTSEKECTLIPKTLSNSYQKIEADIQNETR